MFLRELIVKIYTYQDVKNSYSNLKAKNDLVCHPWFFILRPLSFRVAAFFTTLGLSPTAVTILGILILLVGVTMIAIGGYDHFFLTLSGGVLINTWCLFDCVDGDIARVANAKSKVGNFLDFFAGQLFCYLTPIAITIGLILSSSNHVLLYSDYWDRWILWLIVGIELFSGLMRTAISFKARVSFQYESGARPNDMTKITFRVMVPRMLLNIRAPLFVLAFMLNFLVPYLFLYAFYSFLALIVVFLKCIKRAYNFDQSGHLLQGND